MRTSRKLKEQAGSQGISGRDTSFGAGGPVAELHGNMLQRLNGRFDHMPQEQQAMEKLLSVVSRCAGWLALLAGYGAALYLILK